MVLRCLTQILAIFQLYRGGSFIGGGNRKKTTDLPQIGVVYLFFMLQKSI